MGAPGFFFWALHDRIDAMSLSITLARQRSTVAALHLTALLLLGLRLYVRTLPPTPGALPGPADAESVWWGLWPVTYAPGWAVAMGALAVIAPMLVFWWSERWPQLRSQGARQGSSWRYLLPASLALVAAFFAFPIVHTRWGDAYILTHAIAWPDPALRLTHSWQAPLDVWLHGLVWRWGNETWGWADAMPVYRLLSPLAGMVYLAGVLMLSQSTSLAPAWLSFGLLTTLGLMQLFFGYVENYSFAAAGVLLYLWLGWEVLQRRQPLWAAATVLALTHATHPSTVILAPSLLCLGWHWARTPAQRNQSQPRIVLLTILAIGLPMLAVAGGVLWMMAAGGHGIQALLTHDRPGGGDGRWFVPLWEATTRWEHYTLFSWPHLRDLLNQQLLVAPVIWPGIVIAYWSIVMGRGASKATDANARPTTTGGAQPFLAIAALAYLLFIAIWNPDYGGQRDWDLFSLAALPATVWLAWLLPRVLPTPRYLVGGAAPLILLQGLHMAAWVYQNTLPWTWP